MTKTLRIRGPRVGGVNTTGGGTYHHLEHRSRPPDEEVCVPLRRTTRSLRADEGCGTPGPVPVVLPVSTKDADMEPTEHTDGNTGHEALDAYSQVVSGVAEMLLPRVAAIRVRRRGRSGEAAGSAVALTGEGHLITNAHVVGNADTGEATFADGSVANLEIVGRDPLADLAVGRADRPIADPPVYGDVDDLKIGTLVVAVGNPLGMAGSVSAGIVSGLGRSLPIHTRNATRIVEDVIQTDAA